MLLSARSRKAEVPLRILSTQNRMLSGQKTLTPQTGSCGGVSAGQRVNGLPVFWLTHHFFVCVIWMSIKNWYWFPAA